MKMVPIGYYSLKILAEPAGKNKGVAILSQVDNVIERMPFLKDKFYLVERRGWRGLNDSRYADIKLVEDLSFLEETKKLFPNCICLDIGPADFVDTDCFKPINVKKEYAGIQISQWAEFKRHQLFILATSILKERKFLKFGHFVLGGKKSERAYRDSLIGLSKKNKANIDFPFSDVTSNKCLPSEKEEINEIINKASMGILTAQIEGINRFKMECLSADIPVLIASDACCPTKKHINSLTGEFFEPTPEGLAKTIEKVLKNISNYHPRQYIIKNTGRKNSLIKLKNALREICLRDNIEYRFNDIDWDGRNQSLIWGKQVFKELIKYK